MIAITLTLIYIHYREPTVFSSCISTMEKSLTHVPLSPNSASCPKNQRTKTVS